MIFNIVVKVIFTTVIGCICVYIEQLICCIRITVNCTAKGYRPTLCRIKVDNTIICRSICCPINTLINIIISVFATYNRSVIIEQNIFIFGRDTDNCVRRGKILVINRTTSY